MLSLLALGTKPNSIVSAQLTGDVVTLERSPFLSQKPHFFLIRILQKM